MGKGNVPGGLKVAVAEKFAGRRVVAIYAKLDLANSELLSSPITIALSHKKEQFDGLCFMAIESDEKGIGVSRFYGETNDDLFGFPATTGKSLGSNEGRPAVNPDYTKIMGFNGKTLKSIEASTDDKGVLLGSICVNFEDDSILYFDTVQKPARWEVGLGICGCLGPAERAVLEEEDVFLLGLLRMNTAVLAGRFTDMTGKDFIGDSPTNPEYEKLVDLEEKHGCAIGKQSTPKK